MNEKSEIVISRAVPSDAERLTEISFAAKRIWDYPDGYFDIWKQEPTITPESVDRNAVFKAAAEDAAGGIAGYVSLVDNPSLYVRDDFLTEPGLWMDHLFIDPRYMKRRIGSKLVERAREHCASIGGNEMRAFVDPYARGFYGKTGADFVRMSISSIPERGIPVFRYSPV